MEREEVQKVIDEGGYLYLDSGILFKPRKIRSEIIMVGVTLVQKKTKKDNIWRIPNDEWVIGGQDWRVATQEKINQYVNGTDKQP